MFFMSAARPYCEPHPTPHREHCGDGKPFGIKWSVRSTTVGNGHINGKTWLAEGGAQQRVKDPRLVFSHFDQINKSTLPILPLPEETYIYITYFSVFSLLRSIWIEQKHVNCHFWSLVFSRVFNKNTSFSSKLCFFQSFVFFSCFCESSARGLWFLYIFKKCVYTEYMAFEDEKIIKITHFEYVSLVCFRKSIKKWFLLKVHDTLAKLR